MRASGDVYKRQVDGGVPRQADGEVLGSGSAAEVLDGARLERNGVGQGLAVGVERSSLQDVYKRQAYACGGVSCSPRK